LAARWGGGTAPFPEHVMYFDLRNHFPFQDNSADAVYASHVWEHLYWTAAMHATREVYRILKPGGIIRLAVPNLHDYVTEYLTSKDSKAALVLNEQMMFQKLSENTNTFYRFYETLTSLHNHKLMYDPPLLMHLLTEAGFRNARKCEFQEGGIPEMSQVESPQRLGKGNGFAVEAVK
jgi:predicted SAM-dependent methyltransferase